jgi:[acyl-carrier-protein] S-malonyltransferase
MQFAAVFPGQGSQSLGMLADLSNDNNEIKETFEEASDLIAKDLWAMVNADDATDLNQTINTQPAMLAAGISVWRIWLAKGGCMPVAMAGHSLGEYSALVASGSLDYKEAIKLVSQRATLMQQAVPEGSGGMAAILGLEDDEIVKICADLSGEKGIVEAVNFNSPGQVVIAGDNNIVETAMEKLTEAGAKRAIKLSVSVPSHCSLMKPAADKLSEALLNADFSEAQFPVLQNVAAQVFDSSDDKRAALAKQMHKPVLWVDTINTLEKNYGAETIIEFGPGKILFGLNRRINRKLGNICISDVASLEKALTMCEA